MYKNYKQYVVRGKKQGHHIRTNFAFEKMVSVIDSNLDKYVPDFPAEVELSLPTLTPID